jgi:hypothetical protein
MPTKESGKSRSRKTAEESTQISTIAEATVELAPCPIGQMFHEDEGVGFEGTGMDDYALPFLMILQKNSPQVDKDHEKYVPGAEAGLFYNTATKELYGSKIRVIPVHYERKFAEWVPREQGGGFRGHHEPESSEVQSAVRDQRGRFVTRDGTYMMDTRYHFLLVLKPDGGVDQVVLALSSTGIKKSRLWMTMMRSIRMKGPSGQAYNPPMFSHIYRLTAETMRKDENTWKSLVTEIDRPLSQDEISLYKVAKDFRDQISSGKAKIDEAALDREEQEEDETPF